MIVKVCGITNREDALAAVEEGATALGFNFYARSPRYITPEAARRLGDGFEIWRVGVFVNEPAERVAQIMREAGLDIAQVHGGGLPAGVRVWKAFRVDAEFDCARLQLNGAEAALLDTASPTLCGGTGTCFDWARARSASCKVILAGGLDAGNVRQAIEAVRPWGVDACSRLESVPGRKDHARMARFIRAALEAAG